MEHQKNSVESLFNNAGDYFETRIDLLKLKGIDKSSDAFSLLAYRLIMLLIFFTVLVFFGVGLALLTGDALGKTAYGFFVVGGLYSITGMVLYLFRKQWIKEPLSNLFIKKMLN
ncbi:MAG TPA: hypothetical protein PLP23_05530 [Panacibacter sp.]|nr:hypothetical protein [Panacibacter sp.]